MPLNLGEEIVNFYRDISAQRKVLFSLKKLMGDEKEAEDHMFEVIDELYIDFDDEKKIDIKTTFVRFLKVAAKNKWIDKDRKKKTEEKRKEEFLYIFNDEVLHDDDFEEIQQKKICKANEKQILKNLEKLISDDFKRRIFLAYKIEIMSYNDIVDELEKEGIKKPDGSNYTSSHLRVINHRTTENVRRLIERKYPNFRTKLISEDNGG